MSEHPLQVAIYARVSSEHQAKAATIESQVAALKGRVEEDGHAAEEELCFLDDGYSGGTLTRPGLERLRDVAFAGAIDRVYVHSPDRLARKYAYQVLLVDELIKAGVEVVFLNHAISDSPEDELLLQMQGMIAEYERAKILERSRRGKRHAARSGSVNVLSGAPYGYRYISKQEGGGQARYEILEEEASVVRQVFQWIGRDSVSIGEARRRLHARGVKTKKGKDWWDRATIWAMLKNPAYKGFAAFGKTRVGKRKPQIRPGRGQAEQPRKAYSTYDVPVEKQEFIPVPALVDEALFDAVAEQLAENKRRNRQGGRGAKYLLQGLLQCACCGYSYYGKQISRSTRRGRKIDYAYYRCIGTDAYRFAGERVCDNKQVRTDLLEESVWDDICRLLRDPDRIRREYERRLAGGSRQTSARQKQLETTIHKVQRAIARVIDIFEEGLLTKEEFAPRIRASKERLLKLQEEEAALSVEQSEQANLHVVIEHLEAFEQQLAGGLDDLDWESRREVIRMLVKRVEIDRDDVRVVYKVSPPPFAQGPASRASLQDRCRRDSAAVGPHSKTGVVDRWNAAECYRTAYRSPITKPLGRPCSVCGVQDGFVFDHSCGARIGAAPALDRRTKPCRSTIVQLREHPCRRLVRVEIRVTGRVGVLAESKGSPLIATSSYIHIHLERVNIPSHRRKRKIRTPINVVANAIRFVQRVRRPGLRTRTRVRLGAVQARSGGITKVIGIDDCGRRVARADEHCHCHAGKGQYDLASSLSKHQILLSRMRE